MAFTPEQELAVNIKNCNVIVSAGAGSGKTKVLTSRVIRKLKEGVPIDKMLILTFTNAAAKEMKTRIKNGIKEIESLKEQLEIIDSSYITTFDSFAMSMVKKYHYLLNLSPNLKIIDEALLNLEKERVLDEIFLRKYQENDDDFNKFITDYTLKDDKNVKEIILKIDSKLDLKLEKEEYLNNYLELHFSKKKIDDDKKRYLGLINEKRYYIKELLDKLVYYTDGKFIDSINEALKDFLDADNYDDIHAKMNIKLPNVPRNSSEELKYIKNQIKDILDEIKILLRYDNISLIDDSINRTYSYQKVIIEIIKELNEKINSFKFENDMYEFQDIAKFLIKIIRDNPDIRDELKNNFDEIMIDEYQDTSDLQEIFISLIENNNVYMVGDIKQSIYRFRNANPNIFKSKYALYAKGECGTKIDLNKNFRSRCEVLNNINEIFNDVMDINYGGADYVSSHQMVFGNINYDLNGNLDQNQNMEIINYNYDKESAFSKNEIEAFIIANDINNKIQNGYMIYDKDNDLKRKATYADFAILSPTSTSFALFKRIFEYLNIPLTIYKDNNITEDNLVIMLKNVINFIKKIYLKEFDEEFKYLYISISRSPLINSDDKDIFEIFKNNNFYHTELYKKGYELSLKLDNMSLKDFIMLVFDEFCFEDSLIKIGNVKDSQNKMNYIKELLSNYVDMGYTIFDFSDYLDSIIKKEYEIKINLDKENTNDVKMMTIHGSKGLEFPICYYPDLYKEFNMRDKNDAIIFDDNEGIITKYLKEDMESTIYKDLYLNNYYKEEISEKIRLFYVSLTRAKEKMIFLIDKRNEMDFKADNFIKSKYRTFEDILLSLGNKIDKYIYDIDLKTIPMNLNYNLIKNNNYESLIKKTDDKIEIKPFQNTSKMVSYEKFSKTNDKLLTNDEINNIEFGLKMHELLEIIDFYNPDYSILDNDKYALMKIKRFLENDLLKNIKSAKIYKEYEFYYQDDNIFHGIIDLMLVYDDYIDIIDYKLKNISSDAYINQLNGYKKYIENKFNKKVNIYLYSIIDEKVEKIEV